MPGTRARAAARWRRGAGRRRRRPAAALGVDYITLDNHDGELMPTLQVREQIIRLIRQWKADLVLGPRPHDYHPDHRYTGILLQDAAFMVTVPNIAPDTPSLRQNPVFMYFEDSFQKPNPFTPDVAVSIDDTFAKKIDVIDAHVSQMYEWLPWLNGRLDSVPKDPAARKAMAAKQRFGRISHAVRATLVKYYGAEAGAKVRARGGLRDLRVRPPARRGRDQAAVPVPAAIAALITRHWRLRFHA